MNNIFLVTSAIHGANGMNGQLTTQQRIDQTIETAHSIRVHIPDAKLYLLEGGKYPLDFALRQHLMAEYDDIIDFTYHPFITFAHNQVDLSKQVITVIKGPCESFMLREACKLLTVSDDDRIYKISGRYRLSEEFNLSEHLAAKGKYLMLTKTKCLEFYSYPQKLTYSEYQYSTRLYSFCGSILNKATENYNVINKRLLDLYSKSEYMDLEHMTYLVYDQSDITEVSPIGLIGAFAEIPDMVIKE